MNRNVLHPRLLAFFMAFSLLLLVLFHLFYVAPLEKKVAVAEQALQKKRGKKLTLQAELTRLETLENRYLQEKKNMTIFVQKVLGTKAERLPALQIFLRKVSARYHMEPDKIPFAFNQEDSDLGRLVQLRTSLDLQGGYANLKKLIEELYGKEHFLMVSGLTIKSESEAGNQLKIKLALETYFLDIERPLELEEKVASQEQTLSNEAALPEPPAVEKIVSTGGKA